MRGIIGSLKTMPVCLLAAALIALVAGCGNPQTASSPDRGGAPAPAGKPRVALIMKSLANEFFLTMEEGAKAHQAAHAASYDLIAQGIKDERDVNRQVQLVEQMVAQGVDAIVIAPADSKLLVAACQKAMDAGVVVVNIDNKFDTEVLTERGIAIPFVGPDNRKGARLVGDYVAARLSEGDPVAIVEGIPTAFNAIQRKLGFEDAINAAGLKIAAAQSGSWETSKANQVVSAMITENPGIKAFFCANDSMALGAVAALRAAGKLDSVMVAGFDNISAAQELLRKGEIVATADQHADQLAVFGIEYALKMLAGDAAPEDFETPVDLITPKSLADS
ncbi:MAG TPA: sugar ABC transporter substrate-binding protein [Candidatus Hydrogenedentes bacterium]|jgi:ribose transport system substrate-binding protein|nr:sugar ABC transporter substrate-binding protein [Candidatus Hydrogenedentota bacterium]HPJ99161.1 sugar ABC transporter substrate-binding protein [Candidatus Hydrogenedentota bacterium]